ncbi:serine protease [Elysia marginata]|uniref:Serine protease n=1 Tax=Elysia marginata TaxID=1093978 RepID=A0AAV4FMA5_9GAST|nr:serine protease [Elysia marginata]
MILSSLVFAYLDCGIRSLDVDITDTDSVSLTKRLVGAQEAVRGEFPWQVRLRSFGQLTYSGVLIRPNWVLTAASCFNDNYNPSLWTAVLNDLSSTSVDPGEKVIYVDSIFIYGGFKRGDSQNNLALVKLETSSTSDTKILKGVDIFKLMPLQFIVTQRSFVFGAAYSTSLRKVKVKLFDAKECSRLGIAPSVGLDQMCVTSADSTQNEFNQEGPCTGDRGSPVLCKTGDRWAVVGVVSDEYACQSPRSTAPLIVNVEYFYSWINKIISQF